MAIYVFYVNGTHCLHVGGLHTICLASRAGNVEYVGAWLLYRYPHLVGSYVHRACVSLSRDLFASRPLIRHLLNSFPRVRLACATCPARRGTCRGGSEPLSFPLFLSLSAPVVYREKASTCCRPIWLGCLATHREVLLLPDMQANLYT